MSGSANSRSVDGASFFVGADCCDEHADSPIDNAAATSENATSRPGPVENTATPRYAVMMAVTVVR